MGCALSRRIRLAKAEIPGIFRAHLTENADHGVTPPAGPRSLHVCTVATMNTRKFTSVVSRRILAPFCFALFNPRTAKLRAAKRDPALQTEGPLGKSTIVVRASGIGQQPEKGGSMRE